MWSQHNKKKYEETSKEIQSLISYVISKLAPLSEDVIHLGQSNQIDRLYLLTNTAWF